MKIGYFGDGPWAHNAFNKLVADRTLEICFVCVRNDNPDKILMNLAKQNNIPVLIHPNINSVDFINKIKEYQVDLNISMSFNQIFKKNLINLPRFRTINCHAGKLPFYRGRNILNWLLINDEKEFGITVHFVDEGIDTGDIILQKTFPIIDTDNYSTLLECAHYECANILYDAVKQIQSGDFSVIKQVDIDFFGTYFGQRIAGDEIIDWNQTSREIFNFIRALCNPGPGALSYINDDKIVINAAREVPYAHKYKGINGQVVGIKDGSFFVKTADTIIEITEYTYSKKISIGKRLKPYALTK